jgi:hypothetical protein
LTRGAAAVLVPPNLEPELQPTEGQVENPLPDIPCKEVPIRSRPRNRCQKANLGQQEVLRLIDDVLAGRVSGLEDSNRRAGQRHLS